MDEGRIKALCEGFGQLALKSWNCDTRVDCVDRNILKMMKDSGCTEVAFGIESGAERVIALNEKNRP